MEPNSNQESKIDTLQKKMSEKSVSIKESIKKFLIKYKKGLIIGASLITGIVLVRAYICNPENIKFIKNVAKFRDQINTISEDPNTIGIAQNLPPALELINKKLAKLVNKDSHFGDTMEEFIDNIEILAKTINDKKLLQQADNLAKTTTELQTIKMLSDVLTKLQPVLEYLETHNGARAIFGAPGEYGIKPKKNK